MFTSLCIDSPVIAIVPIDDPRAHNNAYANLSNNNIFYCYSTSTAILKGCGEQPRVPRLTSYSKAWSGPFWPVTAKHMYWVKALIPLFTFPREVPKSAIKAQQ